MDKIKWGGTPGPWIAVGHWVEVTDDSIPDICSCDPTSMRQGDRRSSEEMRANARAIAEVPAMVSALREAQLVIYTLAGALADAGREELAEAGTGMAMDLRTILQRIDGRDGQ